MDNMWSTKHHHFESHGCIYYYFSMLHNKYTEIYTITFMKHKKNN